MSKQIYKQWKVDGLLVSVNQSSTSAPVMIRKRLVVRYTSDKIGKSLSISDDDNGIMFEVPVDAIEKDIREATT